MKQTRRLFIFISLFLILATIVVVLLWYVSNQQGPFKVVFLDVGQGDAIFIQTPRHKQILVDSGPGSAILPELGRVMMPWDRTIDTIIATHPDKDHIGGFPDVLEHYKVASVIDNGFSTTKPLAREYRSLVNDEGSQYMQMITPQRIELSDGVVLTFVRDYGKSQFDLDSNDGSIALRIDYQGYSFFMMGDAEADVEESVLRDVPSELLDVDILKLGHHGSKTSSTEEFLRATSPDLVVISAGLNNSYGHPHKEVLDRLKSMNIPYVCTCQRGRISFVIKDGVMRAK